MEKVIKVGDREIKIKACASTSIRYQQVFGEHVDGSLIKSVGKNKDDYVGGMYESAGKLLYIMAWHCNSDNMALNRDAALEWLDNLGPLSAKNIGDIVQLFFRK